MVAVVPLPLLDAAADALMADMANGDLNMLVRQPDAHSPRAHGIRERQTALASSPYGRSHSLPAYVSPSRSVRRPFYSALSAPPIALFSRLCDALSVVPIALFLRPSAPPYVCLTLSACSPTGLLASTWKPLAREHATAVCPSIRLPICMSSCPTLWACLLSIFVFTPTWQPLTPTHDVRAG
jgi:hypothetical protein